MSMQNTVEDNYSNLIGKLDEFIRKFYVNKAIKGALWFIGLASLLYTLALAFEHFVFLNQLPAEAVSYRKMIFWSFLGSLAGINMRWTCSASSTSRFRRSCSSFWRKSRLFSTATAVMLVTVVINLTLS